MRAARAILLAAALAGATPAPEGSSLIVTVTDLRNHKGMVRACLTASAKAFPDCGKDPRAYTASVSAADDRPEIAFTGIRPGQYALSLLHDENANGKADFTLGMMPREGFGFSRDAKLRMGPPRFADAAFAIGADGAERAMRVRMRYLF